jgi:hypothetical protein
MITENDLHVTTNTEIEGTEIQGGMIDMIKKEIMIDIRRGDQEVDHLSVKVKVKAKNHIHHQALKDHVEGTKKKSEKEKKDKDIRIVKDVKEEESIRAQALVKIEKENKKIKKEGQKILKW